MNDYSQSPRTHHNAGAGAPAQRMQRTLSADAGYSHWPLNPSSVKPVNISVSQAGRTRTSNVAKQGLKVGEDITTENCNMIYSILIVLFVAENV
ncbi:hypothetical protein [Chloroflexus islandicus]|uniref:hypothetical protein n=1 Tax=Chloroflexus islandicus TaxID=1707952 RepID=UPI0012E7B722|nr:hypothetical protein [Chloroflexus islandicus]